MLPEHIRRLMPNEIDLHIAERFDDPLQNILLDDAFAKEVSTGVRRPTVRVWRHAPVRGLVVSKSDVAGERGKQAMAHMNARGWPVFVRSTGGTAVPHGEGVLNLSLLLPRQMEKASTDAYYQLLCQPIVDWMEHLRLAASTGDMPGSYCDGNYNVLVGRQKLVGTAQAWRGGLAGTASRHPGYVLAHACIVVDFDMARAVDAINQFYEEVGDAYRVDVSTTTTLAQVAATSGAHWTALDAELSLSRFLQTYYEAQGVSVHLVSTTGPQSAER